MQFINNTTARLIEAAPASFSRQDLLRHLVRSGYSGGRADQVLEYGMAAGLIERTGRGQYRKVQEADHE